MRERPWTSHLRLLPGGDSDTASALVGTAVIFGLLFLLGLLPAFVLSRRYLWGPILPIGVAGALPSAVIGLWTGLRVLRSKPLGVEEAAALPRLHRVYFGDQTPRVPRDAVVVPVLPRQVPLALADGRELVLWFRADEQHGALLELGKVLAEGPEAELEGYVARVAAPLAQELLPDPEGVTAHLRARFTPCGIAVVRGEVRARRGAG
ncbi:MAG: hypothetical protein AB7N76_03425 [Planctomycetota bacterium]